MLDVGNWAKPKILINVLLNILVPLAQSNVHDNGTLTVTQIVRFLLGDIVDVLQNRRQIVVRHILESELPEGSILIRVVLGVLS